MELCLRNKFHHTSVLMTFFLLLFSSCAEPMTEQEKRQLLNRADKGSLLACYEIFKAEYHSKYEFDEPTRTKYFNIAYDGGYEDAVLYKYRKTENEAAKKKFLTELSDKGIKIATYLLAMEYLDEKNTKANNEKGLSILNELADQGYSRALKYQASLRNNKATNGFQLMANNAYMGWIEVDGSFVLRTVSALYFTMLGLIRDPLDIMFMSSPIPWWQGLLMWVGIIALGILGMMLFFYSYSFDEKFRKRSLSLFWFQALFLVCGVFFTLFYSISTTSSASQNIGCLFFAQNTMSTLWAFITVSLTWLMLISIVVAVGLILFYSKSLAAMFIRLFGHLFFSALAFSLGVLYFAILVFGVAYAVTQSALMVERIKLREVGNGNAEDEDGNKYKKNNEGWVRQ